MTDCNFVVKYAAINCLVEVLDKDVVDADLVLQVCQAMMEPKRRDLIMLAACCHKDHLKNFATGNCACGPLRKDCDFIRAATGNANIPCQKVHDNR